MKHLKLAAVCSFSVLLLGLFAAAHVFAAPSHPGGSGRSIHQAKNAGHYGKTDQRGPKYNVHGKQPSHSKSPPPTVYRGKHRYFTDQHRVIVHDYYARQYRRGHCPPGLAKKGYGCVPRQPARQWVIGRPLARNVIFHDLPPRVLVRLGPPPSHHRFVRVAQDILLIATGTGMVVDAIDNLSWEFSR